MKRTDQKKNKVAILSFTREGFALSGKMRDVLGDSKVTLFTTNTVVTGQHEEVILVTGGLKSWCETVFAACDVLIFIGASGIAVRTIAPFLETKVKDPAVLVADERGKYVISLLSGHLGGGNEYARYLAHAIGAEPVITTASDVQGKLAIDVWAQKNRLVIADMQMAKRVAADIVDGKRIPFYCDGEITGKIPQEMLRVHGVYDRGGDNRVNDSQIDDAGSGDRRIGDARVCDGSTDGESATDCRERFSDHLVYVSPLEFPHRSDHDGQRLKEEPKVLHLIPGAIILGIGCKRGKSFAAIRDFVFRVLRENRIVTQSIAAVASIDLKAEESGLRQLAEALQCPFVTFPAETLQSVAGVFSPSEFVQKTTGTDNVCERSAMAVLSPEEWPDARFLCRKTAKDGVTVAILEKKWSVTFE